jgi:meso-butanediol dehydrogenase / (S,S)-butanediol dehydrogenase / diacetyl reductase
VNERGGSIVAEGDGASRVALVTGAARGIGRGIAERLAADGLDVAVNDVEDNEGELTEVAESIRKAGRHTAAVPGDVSNPDAVEGMVRRVADELGQLNVMVANAGVAEVKALLDLTPDDWNLMMAINLRGIFLCYQAAARR